MQSRDLHGTAISGWFTPEQGDWLLGQVHGLRDTSIALVGIYEGLNLSYIAETCRRNGVRIHAVDIWEKIGRSVNGTEIPQLAAWRFRRHLKRARRAFQKWIRRHGFAACVTVHHASSTAAAAQFADESLDFIFLDADHSYEHVLQDLHAWYGKLRPGRRIAGDDWDASKWPGVIRAVEEVAAALGMEVGVAGKLWWLEKPRADAMLPKSP